MNPKLQERIQAHVNGKDIIIYNWLNVKIPAVVRGHNPVVETFDAEIGAGDSPEKPEYVTTWVADELWHEYTIDVEDYGIEVIDVDSDEVDLL